MARNDGMDGSAHWHRADEHLNVCSLVEMGCGRRCSKGRDGNLQAARRRRDGTEERRRRPLALALALVAAAPRAARASPIDGRRHAPPQLAAQQGWAHLEDRVLRVLVEAAAIPLALLLLPFTAAVASDAADAGDPLFLLLELLLSAGAVADVDEAACALLLVVLTDPEPEPEPDADADAAGTCGCCCWMMSLPVPSSSPGAAAADAAAGPSD